MIYPTRASILRIIAKERTNVTIMLFYNNKKILKIKKDNISLNDFNKLSRIIHKVIEINTDPDCCVRLGLEEVQNEIEEFI